MRRVVFAAFAVAVSGCNCDEVVGARAPEGELRFAEDVSPPLPHLEIGLGAIALPQTVSTIVEVASVGTLPLAITSVSLVAHAELCPTPSGEYRLPATLPPLSLKPDETLAVEVAFTPSSGSPSCTVLRVTTDDQTNPELIAVIRGQGDAAGLCTDRAVIDFGDVLIGTTASDTMTLSSCGTRPVGIVGLEINDFFPPFEFDAVQPTSLAPGESITVPVRFSPTVPQRHSVENGNAGLITVQTDLVGQFFQIALVGNGKFPPACVIDVVPALVNFGFVQASSTTTMQVVARNIGELACTIESLTLRDGVDEFSFSAPSFAAGMTLAPFGVLPIDVTFSAPSSEASADNALIMLSDDPDDATIEVPLQGQVPSDEGCFVNVQPAFVDFGAVALNTLRARELNVTNIGQDPCFIDETSIAASSDPGFIDTSSDFGLIAPGASRTLTVGFRPTQPGAADGTFLIDVSDEPFFGTTTSYSVALSAFTADPGICVTPRHIDFGNTDVPLERTFTISACGAATITLQSLPFTTPDNEFSLVSPPTLPRTLAPGDAVTVTVRYAPVDDGGDTAIVTVVSNDLVAPEIDVTLTGGHTIVPPEAGRYLYFWQIPNAVAGGDVMKVPLQGNTDPYSFWGPRRGDGCAGCHSVSPDGKYVALIEVGAMRFVEADTNLELYLGDTAFLDPTSFSWRPNVNAVPNYQFAYSDGADIRIGTLFDGELGVLQGANHATLVDTMPSWGKDGFIAFVRGEQPQTDENGTFGLQGPTDILLVPEDGGAAVPLQGASQNGMANYYPAFSPNGSWIAFTQSPSASSTIAAADARIRLAPASNSGAILTLDNANDASGPSSYTTWSVDGTFLSFSSQRAGGAGSWDLYLAPMDPLTGADGDAEPLTEVNTADFEHAAQWSP